MNLGGTQTFRLSWELLTSIHFKYRWHNFAQFQRALFSLYSKYSRDKTYALLDLATLFKNIYDLDYDQIANVTRKKEHAAKLLKESITRNVYIKLKDND